MDNIINSINNLIIQTSGGILAFWGASAILIIKLLRWCGEKIAEGANNDLIEKMMPTIEARLEDKLIRFQDHIEKTILVDISEIKEALSRYRVKKHDLSSENSYLKQAIIEDDREILSELRELLTRRGRHDKEK